MGSNLKTLKMITKEKRSEIIRLIGQFKSLGKTAIQASVFKHKVIRVLKTRKTRKKTGRPEDLPIRDKQRIRTTARHLIREDELVTSHIRKNKTGVTASR